jgi:addiction module RelE/StbE family toxin
VIVRWTPTALRDLESLHDYIEQDSQSAAVSTVDRVLAGIDALASHPEMGRTGRIAGTRELVLAPFVVAYRIKHSDVEIAAIIHGARRWPEFL